MGDVIDMQAYRAKKMLARLDALVERGFEYVTALEIVALEYNVSIYDIILDPTKESENDE